MKAIIVNTQVLDKIRAEGMTANEAINAVYGEDIKAIKDERPELKDMKPMDIAFMSIGINSIYCRRYSEQSIYNTGQRRRRFAFSCMAG